MGKGQGVLKWLLIFSYVAAPGIAGEVFFNTYDGKEFVFDIDPEESVSCLMDAMSLLIDEAPEEIFIESAIEDGEWRQSFTIQKQGEALGYPRNYENPVTADEKADIHFIVTSLATRSLISLAMAKDDLEKAGDRIDHVHPLRFLMTIFTDEELKAGMKKIRGKRWVWNRFTAGLKQSLVTESSINNIKDEHVTDFASQIELTTDIIYPTILKQRWDEFIDLLITHVPRKGDFDRYDF